MIRIPMALFTHNIRKIKFIAHKNDDVGDKFKRTLIFVDLTDVVVMEPETARTLRQTLQHLMRDCDRRQELVQELIITNNSLRYKSLRI